MEVQWERTVKKGLIAVGLVVSVLGVMAPATFAEEPLPGGRPPCSIVHKNMRETQLYKQACQHPDNGW